MKLTLIVLILSACACGCHKGSSSAPVTTPITGLWSLIDSPPAGGVFLNFKQNGQFEFSTWDTIHLIQYNRYEVLNDSTVRFFKPLGSTDAIYHVNPYTLSLEGACIVHCSEVYGRVLAAD